MLRTRVVRRREAVRQCVHDVWREMRHPQQTADREESSVVSCCSSTNLRISGSLSRFLASLLAAIIIPNAICFPQIYPYDLYGSLQLQIKNAEINFSPSYFVIVFCVCLQEHSLLRSSPNGRLDVACSSEYRKNS